MRDLLDSFKSYITSPGVIALWLLWLGLLVVAALCQSRGW